VEISGVTRDLREYTKNTRTRLVIGFILVVFLIGDGLIFLIYGKESGFFGLLCLLAALIPVLFVVLFLTIAERIVKKNQSE
jgi:Na+/melibiose symporter-like transporter